MKRKNRVFPMLVSSSIFALVSASDIVPGGSGPDSPAISSSEPDSDTAGVDAFDSSPTGLDRGSN